MNRLNEWPKVLFTMEAGLLVTLIFCIPGYFCPAQSMQQVLASSLPSSPSHPITPCENTGRSFNLHTDNAAWCMCSIIADMQILPTMRGSAPAWVNTFFSRAQLCQHRRATLSCAAGFTSISVDGTVVRTDQDPCLDHEASWNLRRSK